MKPSAAELKKARQLISEAKSLCALTGAGISAESGLKTFRDSGGLWDDYPIEQVATPEGFSQDPRLVWEFYNARRRAADVATPNPAHLALARLEMGKQRTKQVSIVDEAGGHANPRPAQSRKKKALTILTQNVDGLHQQAGSHSVVELHGSVWKVRCTGCHQLTTDHPIELPILPHCESCGALLRPDIVWFGELLDPDILTEAEWALSQCDVFLAVGTSAVVQPAAIYPLIAARRGVPVIEINPEETSVTAVAAVSLRGKAGEVLPEIV